MFSSKESGQRPTDRFDAREDANFVAKTGEEDGNLFVSALADVRLKAADNISIFPSDYKAIAQKYCTRTREVSEGSDGFVKLSSAEVNSIKYDDDVDTTGICALKGHVIPGLSNGNGTTSRDDASMPYQGPCEGKNDAYGNTYANNSANLIGSNGNAILNKILDFLDIVNLCDLYRDGFIKSNLDEENLQEICGDGGIMDSFLTHVVGSVDTKHKELLIPMLFNLSNKSCLHLCLEKWGGKDVCIQCYKYLNHDDGLDVGDKKHLANLQDAVREAREREIEEDVNIRLEADFVRDSVPPLCNCSACSAVSMEIREKRSCNEQRIERLGKLSQGRGVPIGWLVEFTIANDCWDMTTQEVCRKFVYPATATQRCRYVELDHMKKGITGPASTFISHCRGGIWGDLVAAVCDGNADRSRRVWVDIFACRQWPCCRPDLDFDATIRHCSSFLVVCSSLKEITEIDGWELVSRQSNSLLPKAIRDKIAFLRVWCLVETYTATQVEDIPIIMKGGSYRMLDKNKSLFEFEHNSHMLQKMSHLIDISNADATIPSDKEMILDLIIGSDGSGIERLNSKVRGTLSSAVSDQDINAGIVQNAACRDSSCLSLVLANPSDYFYYICRGGFIALLRDHVMRDFQGNINARNSADGSTSLVGACVGGHTDTARLLIENGADIHVMYSDGWHALMIACVGGHIDTARLLIENGADIHVHSSDGWNPLLLTCIGGHTDTARLLIEKGADIHVQDSNGLNALMMACGGGHINTARLLIEKGADIHVEDFSGLNALMMACKGGHTDTARLLIDNGVDIHVQEVNGLNALMMACKGGHTVIVRLLIDNGADIHVQDRYGRTNLVMMVPRRARIDIARLLIEKGAVPSLDRDKGLIMALDQGYGEVESYLESLLACDY